MGVLPVFHGSTRARRWTGIAIAALVAGVLLPFAQPQAPEAEAADAAVAAVASEFDPGYIISDFNFYNSNAMSAAQIQSFLDASIGTCQNGKCLNVAVLPIADRPASYSGDSGKLACAAITGGNLAVSELIYRTQVACGISAKVILVTLQKEQSLVTSKAPSDAALRAAMGQACPDTAGCNVAFAGLGVQIMSGARQLSVYRAAMPNSSFSFKGPGTYNIQYKPNTGCGAPPVNVRNFGTLALYNYTPYQPNAAAMANLYGTGDACSSYGNRNFWRLYTDWFGSPTHDDGSTYGGIMSVSSSAGTLTIRGWAVDTDRGSEKISVNVFVGDGYYGSGVANVTASDMQAWYTAYGAGHTYELTVPNVPSGDRRVCVQGVNVAGSGGVSTVFPCVNTVVAHCGGAIGCPDVVDRVTGANRYAVAADISKRSYPSGTGTVYVTSGLGFADALATAPAAARDGAPLLLTDPSSLPPETSAEIQRLNPTKIIIVGGPASVSEGVKASLQGLVADTTRVFGADRFSASRAIAATFGTIPDLYLATGLNFPDALSAGSVGAYQGRPVVLVNGADAAPSAELLQFLRDHHVLRITIAGGPASVPASVEQALKNAGYTVTRLSGADRFTVAVAASQAYPTADVVYIASGLNYPDALAGSVLAAKEDAPLLLGSGNCLIGGLIDRVHQLDPERVTFLGGPASLTPSAQNFTRCP